MRKTTMPLYLVWNELTDETPENRSQLLGWPDVIQNSMFDECDLASQGYYLGDGNGWNKIPKAIRQQAEETARDRWMLLFQLDTVEQGNFELMFGDCGHIYFSTLPKRTWPPAALTESG